MNSGPVSDDYICASPSTLEQDADPIAMSVHMTIQHYRPGSNSAPSDEMGRDVKFAVRESDAVYGVPFTPFGYVQYEGSGNSAELEGGYVAGDDYITFQFSGYRVEDGRRVALTEKEMMTNLASYLRAIG